MGTTGPLRCDPVDNRAPWGQPGAQDPEEDGVDEEPEDDDEPGPPELELELLEEDELEEESELVEESDFFSDFFSAPEDFSPPFSLPPFSLPPFSVPPFSFEDDRSPEPERLSLR